MTRDEILAMEAGRELDALIHDIVMENSVYDCSHECCRSLTFCAFRPTPPLDYSTDMAAAWTVLLHMRTRGWYAHLRTWINVDDLMVTLLTAKHPRRRVTGFGVGADSICRAALLAVMEVEG